MNVASRRYLNTSSQCVIAIACVASLATDNSAVAQTSQQAQSQVMTTTEQAPQLASGELDSLVAPIALYSDDLLAQTLAASTYPLQIIQLQQWMDKNKNLTGQALADAVAKQPWDPSVQGLVMFPDVAQRMAGNIQWTTDLGNAFLAQQSDVMDAVQRMRAKAQGTGNLKTSSQQVVETKTTSSGKQVIVVEDANPDVVYVPSYDPTVVYGAAPPAYPYYPYTYPGYYPGTALMWGAGIALGAAAWGSWGGHWGDCDWNGGNVKINNNYNYNKNNNFNRNLSGQGGNWQHNPKNRGNAPYGNRQTADRFGGQGARGQGGRQAGAGAGARPGGGAGAGARPGGGAGARPGGGGAGTRPGGGAGARPGGGQAGARPGGGGAKPSTRPAGGTGKNQVGNRSASSRPSSGAKKGGGLGGGGSGNYARASSNRGGKSMGGGGYSRGGGGGRGGGGMSRGGGGRGGGGRGGGGRGGGGGRRR